KTRRHRFGLADKDQDPKRGMSRQRAKKLARLMAAVADAVHFAHRHRLLHRDLKPGNILIHGLSHPYVADFGLAMRIDAEHLERQIAGTAAYMAPEQADSARTLSTAVDVYGLGAILYDMLTGQPPFLGNSTTETLDQVRMRAPVPPRKLNPRAPADLEAICL